MAEPESLRRIAQSRAPLSTWLGIVLLFALFGVIVLAIIGPSSRGDNYEQKRAKAREEKLKILRGDEAKALTGYGWIDKNKGVAHIPISRAMELTVAELSQKKPEPAGPIATPQPAASVAPAGATAPSAAPTATATPTGTPKPTSVAGPSSEIHGQPAAAANPPPAPPGTQPGPQATPAASPAASAARPAVSPTVTATPAAPGSPLPVRGKETPSPTPH
ncbi:MAG: hypothetical protein M3R29_03120 [Verrucomicrobiota bacterium]|nr:hypothetical protein [Verrucomicrobiota bacterium]